jgi:hypothetical protein
MTRLRTVILGTLIFAASQQIFAFDAEVRQIEIQSRWRGLGKPNDTEFVIRNENDKYRIDGREIDRAAVQNFLTALGNPVIAAPSPKNLGLTPEWLNARASEIIRDAKIKEEDDSTYWAIGSATPAQRALFKTSYSDPEFIAKILPDLFRCCHTDDWPGVRITLTYADNSSIVVSSVSQSEYMLPWKIIKNGQPAETFDREISSALTKLLPEGATNRERINGDDFALTLASALMANIQEQWKLILAEGKCGDALKQIKKSYALIGADVNSYHDVDFGVYSEKHGGVEENLHADVRKPSFPQGFSETAILLYRDNHVQGVDDFLSRATRYEQLVQAVPWLARFHEKHPKWQTTLLWVHDASLSNKGMRQFTNDMHLLRKDALAEEVRKVQHDVAVLNVSYGDWWLVLPDKRMILWRYESVSGLLGFKQSNFPSRECSDYQGVTGGCVGAIVSPEGETTR